MDLHAALRDAEKELAEAEGELEALTERVERLRAEKAGLEFAVSRHGQGDLGEDAEPWTEMTRTDAIIRTLELAGRALSPIELAERLQSVGREGDSAGYVSAALSHLKKRDRVRSAGYGRWTLKVEKTPSPNGAQDHPEPPSSVVLKGDLLGVPRPERGRGRERESL